VSFERSHLSFHAGGNTRDIERKPKLVFFQYRYDRLLAPFLLLHTREQVACLSLFFDITVVRHDCDYQQVCDTYEPELVMFESGVPFEGCERPSVRNIGACTKVPKIGFLHADGFGEGRTGFLSDMDHWGVETFFTIATTAAEHTPAIAQNLFVWPNFVNPDVYRDYRLKKDVEVLFTGNKNTLYPWRQKMVGIIPKHFPSLLCSHPGYNSTKAAEKIVMGETYARLLNSAWLVPACGTVAKEIVRKHFEIPACKSCLVSEKSPGLESAGFVDMKNCVFADEHDVIEKLGYLLENRGELQAIIDAGHELVHSRHTMKQRDQVLQWLRLHQRLAPNQKIVQRNAFEPMKVVNEVEATESIHVRSEGGLASLMREGNQLLWDGAIEAAEKKYLQCVAHYRFMPEPLLGLTLCNLLQGRPAAAFTWSVKPLLATLAEYKAIDPDPVEWTYFIVVLLCMGKVREAVKRSRDFGWLRHEELDRIRWVVAVLGGETEVRYTPAEPAQSRLTVHQLPARTFQQWTDHLVSMLRVCGQERVAQRVAALATCESRMQNVEPHMFRRPCAARVQESELRRAWSRTVPVVYFRTDACGFFKRRQLYLLSLVKLKVVVKSVLRLAQGVFQVFTPAKKAQVAREEQGQRSAHTYCERQA
jgi:hypothetical protein